MRHLNISELRQNLPSVLDEIAASGQALLVTKRGRAVVKIMPASGLDEHDDAHPLRGVPIDLRRDFDDHASDDDSEQQQ